MKNNKTNGHKPYIPELGNMPPNCGSSVQKPSSTIIPISTEKGIIALIEQLSGLIDRYNAIYSLYTKVCLMPEEKNPANRLAPVLEKLETAIAAICERIAKNEYIIAFKE